MLDYEVVKKWNFGQTKHTYTQRDTMLYALGVGLGADPMDTRQLRFVFENRLRVVPSMVAVLGSPGFWFRDPRTGADWVRLVHGEQRIEIFRPIPAAATVIVNNRVVSITDKGPGKGAVAVIRRYLFLEDGDGPLACSTQVTFLRGDGGFSESSGVSDPAPEPLPQVPEREPDVQVELASLQQAALIYRLSGDDNPLHADPAVARAAGFERPILHGLCTFGMAMHAVLQAFCNYDPGRIKSMAVRFTAPVYPGEKITFQFWRSDGGVHLRARLAARDTIVLNNGIVEFS